MCVAVFYAVVNQPVKSARKVAHMAKSDSTKKVVHRSSESGRFVKESYAKGHPRTTEREVVKVPKKQR